MPNDEKLRRLLSYSAFAYAISGLYMFFMRKRMDEDFKRLDKKKRPPEDFWHSLGVAYMATIASVAATAGKDRMSARKFIFPLLVGKGATTAMFSFRFLKTRRPSYAVSAVTDGAILAAMSYLMRSSDRSSASVDHNNVRSIAS